MAPIQDRGGLGRAFSIFWLGQTLSALGDAFALLALPMLVLEASGSVAVMGLVTAAAAASRIVAGFAAGIVVDRVDRRRLMLACDVGRAAAYALVPLAWWLGAARLPVLFAVTVVGAALGMFFAVAYVAAIPNLVSPGEVLRANGRMQISFALAQAVGGALAGTAAQHLGGANALAVGSLAFVASAVALATIRFRRDAPLRPAGEEPNPWRELREGARFLLGEPVLRTLSWMLAVTGLSFAAMNDLLVYRMGHEWGGARSTIGLVIGMGAIGSIAAGLLVSRLRARLGFGVCYLGPLALSGLAVVGMGLARRAPWLAAFGVVLAFSETLKGVTSMSFRQQITPDHLLGRVTAFFWILVTGLGPLGAALTTSLAAVWGTSAVLIGIGVSNLVLFAVGLRTPARQREPARA